MAEDRVVRLSDLQQMLEGLGRSSESGDVHITEVSGYVETPIRKACATCGYYYSLYCSNEVVGRDDEVPGDPGSKRVSGENGCCDEWEPK
jgi:hypothetical protein